MNAGMSLSVLQSLSQGAVTVIPSDLKLIDLVEASRIIGKRLDYILNLGSAWVVEDLLQEVVRSVQLTFQIMYLPDQSRYQRYRLVIPNASIEGECKLGMSVDIVVDGETINEVMEKTICRLSGKILVNDKIKPAKGNPRVQVPDVAKSLCPNQCKSQTPNDANVERFLEKFQTSVNPCGEQKDV